MLFRADMSVVQEVFGDMFEKKHTLQFRLDVLNIGNLLNKQWGVSQRFVNLQPLIPATAPTGDTKAWQTMRVVNGALMDHTFEKTSFLTDVYSFQLSVRYFFN